MEGSRRGPAIRRTRVNIAMKMPTYRAAVVLLAAWMACLGANLPAADVRGELDQALRDAITRGAAPGAVVIAADRSGVLYEGAFGVADLTTGRLLTTDALFHIASMTKPVTTVALLQLVEGGRIALDDPAEKFLPELGRAVVLESFEPKTGAYRTRPLARKITVRQLLTHTAGFGYSFVSATLRDFKPRGGERMAVPPLLFEPGTQWLYSTGVDYAGKIVESLSGLTLEHYFREKIFRPLGMRDTSYNVPEEKQRRIVPIHRRAPDGALSLPPGAEAPPRTLTNFNGGGGLRSTARDYLRFLRMILNGGTLEGARILSPETVAEMGRNQIGDVSVPALASAQPDRSCDLTFIADGRDKWGLGFLITTDAVPGRRSAGTLSWGGINNTYFWLDPQYGVAGVILMQFLPFADPRALELYAEFERGVYRIRSP